MLSKQMQRRWPHCSSAGPAASGAQSLQRPALHRVPSPCPAARASSVDSAATDGAAAFEAPLPARHASATTRRAGLAQLAAAIASAAAPPALASSERRGCGLPPLAAVQVDYDEFARTYDELDDSSLAKGLGFQELRWALRCWWQR